MTIYRVNQYNAQPVFFVPDQATASTVLEGLPFTVKVGTQADAAVFLQTAQAQALEQCKDRFSICVTEIVGGNTLWRALAATDPNETTCQVFNTFTGTYAPYPTVTAAQQANMILQQQLLASFGMDSLLPVDSLPLPPPATAPVTVDTPPGATA